MKKAIFSVITGDYDELPIAPKFEGWDSIMFTDEYREDSKGWDIRYFQSDNPLLLSREVKILPHKFIPEYDLVCYIDGNQKLLKEPPNEPVWFTHIARTDIFQEAAQIIKNGRFPREIIDKQINYYRSQGYAGKYLFLNGFHVRRNDEKINRLHDVWYEETCKFAPRDQVSLPYACWKTGILPENITSGHEKGQYAIIMKGHKQNYYL